MNGTGHHRMHVVRSAGVVAAGALALAGCAFDQTTLDSALKTTEQVVTAANGSNNEATVAAGIREALAVGSERAATTLSAEGGYAKNPLLHIALPEAAQPVAKTLREIGMGRYVDRVEGDMNHAAELAAAKAVPVFRSAVAQMTLTDAIGILKGNDHAATDYFRGKTETNLRAQFAPIIHDSLQKTGYYDSYREMLGAYEKIPLVKKPSLDLEQHVLDKSLDGLFVKLADEEKQIRQDPAKQTTALLKQVFGHRPQ